MAVGRVLRFDSVKGYGFIEPDDGGEDLFLHVNDLLVEKSLIRAGVVVTFDPEIGDKGKKAARVELVGRSSDKPSLEGAGIQDVPAGGEGRRTPLGAMSGELGPGDDELCVVLTSNEFVREVTELLLRCEPTLNGQQIVSVREGLTAMAMGYRWLDDGE